jgi:hypothetical protein
MKLTHWLVCLAGLVVSMPDARAQADKDKPRMVELSLQPAPEANPAFAYRLHVPLPKREGGNSALSYYRAITLLPNQPNDTNWDRMVDLLGTNVASLRSMSLEALPKNALRELRTGAHREYCRWELPMKDGMGMLLPELAKLKRLAQAAAVQARIQIAHDDWEGALDTLTDGFALGHDAGSGSTLINGLVGIAIGQIMLNQVEQFVQQPGAPNLYWALSALPRPYVDLRLSMEWENRFMFLQFPELRDLENRALSVEAANRLLFRLAFILENDYSNDEAIKSPARPEAVAYVFAFYPLAKRALQEQGFSKESLESFPAAQVTLIHVLRVYQHYSQNSLKWSYIPYYQTVRFNLSEEVEKLAATNDLNQKLIAGPVLSWLPALSRAHMKYALLERNLALLRCIEAIRIHAAQNQGKLPGSLEEIQAVPVPINPITGSPFLYKIENGKGILEASSPPGEPARSGLRYVIALNNTTK